MSSSHYLGHSMLMRKLLAQFFTLLANLTMIASTIVGTFIFVLIISWNWNLPLWLDFVCMMLLSVAWYFGGFFISNLCLDVSFYLQGLEGEIQHNNSGLIFINHFSKKNRLSIFKKLRQRFDPVNQLSPAQVVRSVSGIWSRVPLAIYMGYHGFNGPVNSVVNQDALVAAMYGTDIQVYGRNESTCMKEEPLTFAIDLLSRMKQGSKVEKLSDATMALLLGEMLYGGTNISVELGTKAMDLGFTKISKPIIEKLCSASFPPSEELVGSLVAEGLDKALNVT